ncbi:putative protein isoform X2 [Capsicum galapagoense]
MRGSIMAVASTKKKSVFVDGVTGGIKVKQLPFMGIICTVLFIVFRTTNYQYEQTRGMMVLPFIKEVEIPFNSSLLTIIFSCVRFQMESKMGPFYSSKDSDIDITHLNSLPHGIMHARSDLELKPLWSTSHSKSKLYSLPLNLSIRSFPLLPKVIHFQYQAFEGKSKAFHFLVEPIIDKVQFCSCTCCLQHARRRRF